MTTRKKRKHPRAKAKGLAVHLIGQQGATTCTVEDISLGGLFIRTVDALPPGTPISFTLARPGMKKGLSLHGKIVNARKQGAAAQAGVGVQFESISEEQKQRLLLLLDDLGLANPTASEVASETADADEPLLPQPAPFFAASTSVMSSADVAKHLASSLAGDWSKDIPAPPAQASTNAVERLTVQIRGLLMQLGEAQERIAAQDNELLRLREELEQLRQARRAR